MSRKHMSEHVAFGGLERSLTKINDQHSIYNVVFDLAIPKFKPREWVTDVVWQWVDGGREELNIAYRDRDDDGNYETQSEYVLSCRANPRARANEASANPSPPSTARFPALCCARCAPPPPTPTNPCPPHFFFRALVSLVQIREGLRQRPVQAPEVGVRGRDRADSGLVGHAGGIAGRNPQMEKGPVSAGREYAHVPVRHAGEVRQKR